MAEDPMSSNRLDLKPNSIVCHHACIFPLRFKDSSHLSTSLLVTCRQTYDLAIRILYSDNCFSFLQHLASEKEHVPRIFFNAISLLQSILIRKLHLQLKVLFSNEFSSLTIGHSHVPKIWAEFFEDEGMARAKGRGRLTGLRKLSLDFHHNIYLTSSDTNLIYTEDYIPVAPTLRLVRKMDLPELAVFWWTVALDRTRCVWSVEDKNPLAETFKAMMWKAEETEEE